MTNKRLEQYMFEIQKIGGNSFSRQEALDKCGLSPAAFQATLALLSKRGAIISPKKGFYVIVPPEYHHRPLPPSTYIDTLMKTLGKPYYVGVLSAAAMYGASHQQPMEFQVVTKGPLRKILLPEIRIYFFSKKNISRVPVTKVKTKFGYMNVSTPEVTALDLVKYIERAGYLDNVVNTLIELSSKLRARHLATVAKLFESTLIQRLGYLLDTYTENKNLTRLMWEVLNKREPQPTLLSINGQSNAEEMNKKWLIWINETVEPDI